MTKNSNFEDLTEEELAELLEKDDEDMKADETKEEVNSEGAVVYQDKEDKFDMKQEKPASDNKSSIREEIEVQSLKDLKKQEKEKRLEEKRLLKAKNKMIKQHRKAIAKNPEKLIRYETDIQMGLSNEIVEKRILDNLVNDSKTKTTKSIPKIIFSNVVTFFNILTFTIAGILISVQAFTDLVFLLIVTANMVIGIIQEIRAKKTIDRLSLMSAPTAIVRRDGVNHEVAVTEVVLDDLLLLENGKQICADSIVVDGQVEVNESLLTGESDAIVKKVGDTLFSGSFVVSGKCCARVDKIGKDNYIEQLTSQAKKYKKPKSDLLISLTWIIRVMAVLIIPIGALLFYTMYFKNDLEFVFSIRKTAGAMIGMIPSGLFLMTSIALAVGVIRLAQQNVLVQELYCIEMLARVNCICLDKTGTITDGTMSVKNVIDYNTIYGLATKNIISAMLNALQDSNLTSVALQEKFGLGKRIKHTAAIPFSSQRKYQAVTFDKFGTFILGAPEFVLKDKYSLIKNDVNKYAALGYRVLCLAHREGGIKDGALPNSPVEVVSMILIEDNIRPDAINTIRYFKESGVSVRVISGDNPLTVSKISQRAGIENAGEYISLDGLSDQDVKKAAMKYTVFGRVSPGQKKLLIETLKENGLTVAMTGDGVNDILALKEADCSIAVASGSEAARNVSHLVLLDSNFDSMPKVVSEGRRVINNVTSVASLFLTKTIFSLFLAIQALQTGSYPISTNQLILIDTLAIGLPSLVLVMEPNNNNVEGKFLTNVIKKALPGAIVILLISIIAFSLSTPLSLDATSLSTIIVIAATHTCLMVLFKTCRPFNTLRKFLCTICYTLFLFFIVLMPQFLEFRPLFSFAEYYSNDLTTKVISSYPSVEISKENYYVIDGIVTTFQKSPNGKNENITAVLDSSTQKYYYQIGGTLLDTEVIIPNISYSDTGKIYLGGYKVDNYKFNEVVQYQTANNLTTKTVNLAIRKDGVVCYKGTDGKLDALLITLSKSRNNEYYNHYINYGNAKDTQVEVKVMPTVELKNGELLINGKNSEQVLVDGAYVQYKYQLSEALTTLDKATVTIEQNETTHDYELLVNGKPVVKMVGNDITTAASYTVEIPVLTTNADAYDSDGNEDTDNSGLLYLDAVDTEFNIFEIYGEELSLDNKTTSYVLHDEYNNKIEYIKTDKTVSLELNDVKIDEYVFKDIYNGFGNYQGNAGAIHTNSGDRRLEVIPDTSNYRLTTDKESQIYYPSIKKDTKETRLGVSIAEASICPDIDVTASGKYIIDGYYTEYDSTNEELNPKIDDNNNLILGGVTTNYKVSSSDIMTQKGGIVKPLSVSARVFLLMLCLISAPLMKILQGLVPWIVKQAKLIQKLLSKF